MTDDNKDSSVTFSSEASNKEQQDANENATVVAMEAGVEQSNHNRPTFNASSRLSFISKAYDIRHEGKLDETEQKMRAMDREGRGYLTNQQVYDILQDQSRTQKALLTAKRLLIFFAVLLCILAAANIGIAFAAARLAKDTSVEGDVLVVKGTDTSVATNSHADLFDITTTQQVANDGSGNDQVVTTMERQDAEIIYASCIAGGSVNLLRTWPDYRFNAVVSLCPADSYPKRGDVYNYAYASGNNVQVDCSSGEEETCTVSGSGLLQQVEQDCVYNEDCATGNCFFEEWIPRYDPGTCKCLGTVGCADDETCVENECRGPNADNDNIIV